MPYVAIPASWIVAGKPTKEEIFQYIRDNQESFNTDIEALKQTAVIDIFDMHVNGDISNYTQAEMNSALPVFKSPVDLTITSVVFTLLEPSTSGTLAIELEVSTDNGVNWSPIFSSPVQLTGTAVGSLSGAVNFVNVAAQSLSQNDLLRININTVQVDQGGFQFSVYGELA